MATSLSRLERVYMQDQADFLFIPGGVAAGSGSATVANGDAVRHIAVALNPAVETLIRRDKTGSRTATEGVRGRSAGDWSYEGSLAPNGVAGTEPDFAPLLKAVFGAAPTVNSGSVSVTAASNATPIVITAAGHSLADGDLVTIASVGGTTDANGTWVVSGVAGNDFALVGSVGNAAYTSGGTASEVNLEYGFVDQPILPFTMYSFRTPSGLAQRCAFGCLPQEINFSLGQDVAEFTSSGRCRFVIDTSYFSSGDVDETGGLATFPTEPVAPVTSGGIIAGFTGRAVIGGVEVARIRTASIKIESGNTVIEDNFGAFLPNETEGAERSVTIAFSLYDSDEAAIDALRVASITKTGVDFILNIGTVVGSIVVLRLKGVQLSSGTYDDSGNRFVLDYADSRAFGSSLTALDELTMWIA